MIHRPPPRKGVRSTPNILNLHEERRSFVSVLPNIVSLHTQQSFVSFWKRQLFVETKKLMTAYCTLLRRGFWGEEGVVSSAQLLTQSFRKKWGLTD
jgi:hypothetical protein